MNLKCYDMSKFALINGKIATHKGVFDGTVFVEDGKILKVEKGHIDTGSYETIDVNGKYILPGLIDAHVHFRTPGGTEKEDWVHGSKAALAGGVTTVLDMPNTNPPTVSQKLLDEKRELVKKDSLVNYGFFAGAAMDNVEEVAKMTGIAGIKVYMGSSTGSLLVDDLSVLERFMVETKHLLVLHAENEDCINEHTSQHKGESDPGVHSKNRDPECAYEAVKDALHLAKKHDSRVHIAHLSTEKELETVRKFKNDKVSVEVTPHHLFLTDGDYDKYENLIKMNPPVRSQQDQVALWEGIKDGTVDMVATDHAPHLLSEKKKYYGNVPSGVPGVQTMLPLLLNSVNEGKLSLEKVVELTSSNPAKVFKIKDKGLLEPGYDADIVIVDMNLESKVDKGWSKCEWSPFEGWELKGWPVKTFVKGDLMYEWKDSFGENRGGEVEFDN